MQDFRKLLVWGKAHQLTLSLYQVTTTFPATERYGLTSQIRRASASICANLAEGRMRGTARDFARFTRIALGSASELEYHLLLASDLQFLTGDIYLGLHSSVVEIKKMLTSLGRRLMADG